MNIPLNVSLVRYPQCNGSTVRATGPHLHRVSESSLRLGPTSGPLLQQTLSKQYVRVIKGSEHVCSGHR